MLYLNPPFFLIDGVSLFPDHADPLQYYFLPMQPHFTMIPGPDGTPVPSLSLIKYAGDAGAGGFLNFDCDLSLPPGTLDDVAGQLRTQAKLTGAPRLSPVPFVDGSVTLLLLGQQSPPPPDPHATATPHPATPPPATPDAGPKFVLKIQGASKPSLYGDNNATFSVALDPSGVAIMEQALQGVLSPMGIVYELDFLALRPAFAVSLSIDWNRVQTRLDDEFTANVLFFSADIDKAVDKLIEDQVIQINVDTFVPEGEDDSVIADRDKAVNEVREMVKSTFFTSSIPPPAPGQPDGWDKATKMVNTVSQLAATGGWSSMASFGYHHVDLTRIDQKSLNVNINERTTIRRQIYPQGHLAGLCNMLRNAGFPLDKIVTPVHLGEPYFARRNVNVVSRAAFDIEQLQAISVNLQYGPDQKTVELTPTVGSGPVGWTSILAPDTGAMTRDVQYTCECVFSSKLDRSQRPLQLTSDSLTTDADTLEIQPSSFLYAYANVPIVGLGTFWDAYPTVQVDLKYDDDANQIHLQQTFLLSQANGTAQNWQLFMRDTTKRVFQYRVTYRAANNRDVAGSWTSTDQETVIVRDPFPNKRTLMIAPAIDWTKVDRVFVDVSYTEADGTISAEGHYEFNQADTATKTFTCPLKDATRRQVGYQVTILNKGGVPVTVPASVTRQPRLIVTGNMRGHRIISVHPANVDFTAKQIKEIDVDMAYVDETNQISIADSFVLKSAGDVLYFEYDYVDDQQSGYSYKMSTQYKNGLNKSVDWTNAASDDLVIPVGS